MSSFNKQSNSSADKDPSSCSLKIPAVFYLAHGSKYKSAWLQAISGDLLTLSDLLWRCAVAA